MQTHALSLRRAVQGRIKPFDDLLREHRDAKEKEIIKKYAEKGIPVPPKMLPSKSRSSSSSSQRHATSGSSSSSQNSSKQDTPSAAKVGSSSRQSSGSQPSASPSATATSQRTPLLGSPPHIITSPVSTTTKITKPPMLPRYVAFIYNVLML